MSGIRRVSQLGTTGESTFVDGSVVLGTDTTGNYVSTVVAGTAISVSGATGNVTVTNSGVTALTTSSGLSTNTSATGAVSVTNTGVTALTTSSGLSTNTSATGAVSVTNTGVTSAVAGTGVSVSGATGAVTLSIGQSVATSASPTFSSAIIGQWDADGTFHCVRGRNGYLLLGHSGGNYSIYLRTYYDSTVFIGGNGANTLAVTSASAAVAGYMTVSGYIAVGGTGIGDGGSVSASGWFRSTGNTGWYNQTYGGGIYMEDSTFVRIYNGKRFYAAGGIQSGIGYGNYGSMSVWSKNNGWAGICFPDNAVTWMQLDDSQFGVQRYLPFLEN